jgi:hypothetical protein
MVGLAKALTPTVDEGIAALGAPKAVVGIVIAAVVLMPEGLAALRAARTDAAGIRDDASRRTHHSAPGRRAPSDPGRLPVPCHRALNATAGGGLCSGPNLYPAALQ